MAHNHAEKAPGSQISLFNLMVRQDTGYSNMI